MLRNHVKPNEREAKEKRYKFRLGTTAWTKESVRKFVVDESVTQILVPAGGDAMDIS